MPTDQVSSESGGAGKTPALGDLKQALTEVLNQHGPRLFAVANQLLSNRDDARDAFQEGMLAAWRSLPSFAGRSELSTWVHRIVVNHALKRLREKGRAAETPIEELLPTFTSYGHHRTPPRGWTEEPDVIMQRAEMRSLVNENIARLPATYRIPLVLREIEGIKMAEIATMLDVTPNAVRIRVHRGRQALKTLLEPHLGEVVT